MTSNKKIAWITGGGTGIGSELAKILVKNNWIVAISGRRLEKLNQVKKNDPERMSAILFTIVEQIKNISILLNPIIPNATNKVLAMINISTENISIDKIKYDNILNNEKEIGNLEILFTKIDDDN